jgi:adenosylcobyric acid synthase
MFQGTGSDVGKSLIVAGLCRLFARRGLKVAPFKAQNMSNNAAVAGDGGEIGRAQWLQALASGTRPSVHMNPVLLKPQSDKTSQVILRGKFVAAMGAKEYHNYRKTLLPQVLESYEMLARDADLALVEGAGSPAEINLRENDIANMGFARAADCPVVLIGDIERGGVIASIVGTHAILPDADREMIKGFVINKFRGDASLFTGGIEEIEKRTGWKNLGLIPHFPELLNLPQEDSLALSLPSPACGGGAGRGLHIAVLKTPHIANFDDIDPLAGEENICVTWVCAGQAIPADAKLVILAGSKSTIADLEFIKRQGWDIDLKAHLRRGGRIIGICGGYQMLGKTLSDPYGVEGAKATVEGLGLLDIDTIFTSEKTVKPWAGKYGDIDISGYEIHVGISTGADCIRPLFNGEKPEGACSENGLVWGSYIHGIFANDNFRKHLLSQLGAPLSAYNYKRHIERVLDAWAETLEKAIDIEQLLLMAG